MNMPPDISRVLTRALEEAPDKVAVTASSGSLTYAELDSLANRAAHAFEALGVKRGDRVAVCLPNDLEIVVAFHGAMRLGAIWVGINQALAAPEKAYIVRDSGAKLALFDPATAEQVDGERASLPDLEGIVALGEHQLDQDVSWAAAVEAQDDSPLAATIDPFEPAAIAYTSGTTGYPKGAVHSQTNLMLPGAYLVSTRRYGAELRKGDAFPLTILNLLVLSTLLTSQAGGTSIVMDRLEARAIADWIRDEHVGVWNGPPPVLYTMAHDDSILPTDLDSLEEVWSGGADCPETIRRAFEQKFHATVYGTYGLSEAPTVVTIEVPSEPHASGSSGKALPHMEVTIRDPAGAVLPAGEVGEICVAVRDQAGIVGRLRSDWGVEDDHDLPLYRAMLGYWNRPDATTEAMRDGVLHTGDVGSLDVDGNLSVTDRINLVLNRGGANVYPAEVERVVLEFTAVDACAVLGVADERLGQRVGMLVQFKPGHEADVEGLIAHCRGKLARYKVPELVTAVDSLPRNSMGKIDRRALSELGQRELANVARVA